MISQLRVESERLRRIAEQAAQQHDAAERRLETLVLTGRGVRTEFEQRLAVAENKITEERRMREGAEQVISETRISLAHIEGLRVAAEQRNAQLLAQQQFEIQREVARLRQEEADRRAAAQKAAHDKFESVMRRF